MAFTTVPDKASGDPFTEAMWDTYVRENINAGGWTPVAETLLAGNATSITFSEIDNSAMLNDADWKHLLIMLSARSNSPSGVFLGIRFNGDAGSNYDVQYLQTQGTVISAGESFAQTLPVVGTIAGTAAASSLTHARISIPSFRDGSIHVSAIVSGAYKQNTSADTDLQTWDTMVTWNVFDTVNSIDLIAVSGTLIAGTRAILYARGG